MPPSSFYKSSLCSVWKCWKYFPPPYDAKSKSWWQVFKKEGKKALTNKIGREKSATTFFYCVFGYVLVLFLARNFHLFYVCLCVCMCFFCPFKVALVEFCHNSRLYAVQKCFIARLVSLLLSNGHTSPETLGSLVFKHFFLSPFGI